MTVEEIKAELGKMVPAFAAKIAPVYKTLEWQWSPGKSVPHIPSVDEIENMLYSLIEGVTGVDNDEVCAGGLSAYYSMPDDNGPGCYGLTFECEKKVDFD